MAKTKIVKDPNVVGMTKAPWFYVCETRDGSVGRDLSSLIPDAIHLSLGHCTQLPSSKSPIVITDSQNDDDVSVKITRANFFKQSAMKYGSNFVSINVISGKIEKSTSNAWGTNHLDIAAAEDAAETIYKWLFTVLTVRETLHLIPEEQMTRINKTSFSDYAYCPVAEVSKHGKNEKLQFVVLIMSKPQVQAGKKLIWAVADRSGIAHFHFTYRGEGSQFTWDWVLGLQPGDRRILPRMPKVEIKEKKRITIAKAPFRATAAIFLGTGLAMRAVGHGLGKVGTVMRMGPSSEWVAEADLGADGKKIDWDKISDTSCLGADKSLKRVIEVFNEKGEKSWSDGASVASTDGGNDFNEKSTKEFI